MKEFAVPQAWAEAQVDKMHPARKRTKRKKQNKARSQAAEDELTRIIHEGGVLLPKKSVMAAQQEAERVAMAYAKKHAHYYTHRTSNWRSSLKKPGILGCCSAASINATSVSATAEDFVEAQFWFFHRAFGKAPGYSALASKGSCDRYAEWVDAVRTGEAPPRVVDAVVTVTVTTKEVYEHESRMLKMMSARWGGEEKVWELFGSKDAESPFSDEFKETREVYRSMFSD